MSAIAQFIRNVGRIARSHDNSGELLDLSAEMLVREVKGNIDKRQNAGAFRVEDAGTVPNEPMMPLSAYTVKRREQEGIFQDHPLKATGDLYRSISVVRKNKRARTIGAKGRKNQKKLYAQLGTAHTGVVSSERRREIPPRNPVGYSQATSEKIKGIFLKGFGARDKTQAKLVIKI